jgi:tight adherence protein B
MIAGIPMQSLVLFGLVAMAIGGVAWVFLLPVLSGEHKAEKRYDSVAKTQPMARSARGVQRSRREQVEETLKEMETRQKKDKRPPLNIQIEQAGLTWSKNKFLIIAAGLGVFGFLVTLGFRGGLIAALGMGFVGACGLPMWLLKFLKKRREAKFLDGFPDAVDIIVRGIKAGLPLLDCIKVIAAEAPEPIKSEFKSIIETQTVGIPLGEACAKLYERIPVAEANFFGIVISIQSKSGGNLSEALGNLSRVLRDRKRMKAKILAMSMEAKASAAIIGSLPIAVMLLVYITSPQYISLLWTEPMGRMMMAACGAWMTMGVLVMRKMINFDF